MSAGAVAERSVVRSASQDSEPEGTLAVPGTWLDLLATTRQAKLFSAEWRVVAIILASPRPMTAASIAKRLRLAPTHGRRTVRGLVAWGILQRTPGGVLFQPDPSRWGPPTAFHRTGGIVRE